jgi:hypothetical protein
MSQEKIGRKLKRSAHEKATRDASLEEEIGRRGGHALGDMIGNMASRESFPSITPQAQRSAAGAPFGGTGGVPHARRR